MDRLEVVGQQKELERHTTAQQKLHPYCMNVHCLPSRGSCSIPGVMVIHPRRLRWSVRLSYLSVSLFVQPGNTNSVFALDYISGSLTVNGQLDRENPLYSAGFSLTVRVSC